MIPEDTSPAINGVAPPPDIESATATVGNLTTNGLYGLIASWFKDMTQLRQAMTEAGWNMTLTVMPKMDDKPDIAITYRAEVVGKDGSKWELLLNLWRGMFVQVSNAHLVKAGDEQPILKKATESVEDIIARLASENEAARKTPKPS